MMETLKPHCGHGNCAFRRPVDAIAYFKDYALSVTSQRQLDHVFPAAFAGALHNVAKLTARMPAMKDLVTVLGQALRLWLQSPSLDLAHVRSQMMASKTNFENALGSTSGTQLGQVVYVLDNNNNNKQQQQQQQQQHR